MNRTQILLITLIPFGAALIGGLAAAWRKPSKKTLSLIQHFAAGVVFAGVAGEVIPDIESRSVYAALIGFGLGVPLVIAIRKFTEWFAGRWGEQSGLAIVTAIDLAVDGMPVAIGFVIGGKTGLVLTMALSLELFALSLAVAGSLPLSRIKRLAAAGGLGGLFWLSTNIGAISFANFPASAQTAILAIGAVIFLYLATEELLREAHEVKETSVSTIVFFGGFVLLLMVEMLL